MTNPWRGDVSIVIDGQAHDMRLTLGALAELEAKIEANSLVDLVQRFEGGGYAAGDVIDLLDAGLKGGKASVGRDALLHGEIEGGPVAAAQAAAQLLARAFVVPAT